MADQTVVPAPSPEVEDVYNGKEPSFHEISRDRESRIAAHLKPAEPADTASADTPEQTESEIVGESGTPKDQQQEKPGKKPHATAEQRQAQLKARVDEELEKPEPNYDQVHKWLFIIDKIDQNAGSKRKAEPAPVIQQPPQVQAQPQFQQPPQYTRPKPTIEDRNQDGTPKYSNYEDFTDDRNDWKIEQYDAARNRRQFEQEQARKLDAAVISARERYGDEFESVIAPTYREIWNDPGIPNEFKELFKNDVTVPDVMHVIGKDSRTKEQFIKMAKEDAVEAIKFYGQLQGRITSRNEKGQFTSPEPPAKTRTSAPKPPSPVGGGSSRGAFDPNDDSGSHEEWARLQNERLARKRRGGY